MPGQVYYNATRKLVLRGADGVVFVADSQPSSATDNVESLRNLHENLSVEGLDPRELPLVMQYNKRDLPGAVPAEELSDALNFRGVPEFGAVAVRGDGVFETLRAVSELVLRRLSERYRQPIVGSGERAAPRGSDSADGPAAARREGPP